MTHADNTTKEAEVVTGQHRLYNETQSQKAKVSQVVIF